MGHLSSPEAEQAGLSGGAQTSPGGHGRTCTTSGVDAALLVSCPYFGWEALPYYRDVSAYPREVNALTLERGLWFDSGQVYFHG